MMLKPQLTEQVRSDLELFGLSSCAEEVLSYIARQPFQTDFFVSLTDLVSNVSCSRDSIEQIVNYLASARLSYVLQKAYCFIDAEHVFHELDDEALQGLQETQKLYHPSSGKEVPADDVKVFLLYKANVNRVAQ